MDSQELMPSNTEIMPFYILVMKLFSTAALLLYYLFPGGDAVDHCPPTPNQVSIDCARFKVKTKKSVQFYFVLLDHTDPGLKEL